MIKKYCTVFSFLLVLGFLIRLLFVPVTTGPYMLEYFIPFIDQSILNPFQNPWSLSEVRTFPYGLISFIIFYIPKSIGYLLFGSQALGGTVLSLFLMKLPLFVFDFIVFKILFKLFSHKGKSVYFLYWLNPIVIYITFIYSHIDIISVAFFLTSLYFMINQRPNWSAVFFGLSFASKFYVFAALPLLLVYIWNTQFAKEALKNILSYLLITGLFLILGFLPLIGVSQLSYATLSSPEAMRVLNLKVSLNESIYFYIGVALVLLAIFRLFISTKISRQGLVLGSYFVFGILIFVSFPFMNWYLWVIPGLVFFYLSYKSFHRYVFLLFLLGLMAQIVLFEFYKDPFFQSLVLTVSQTVFALLLITLWVVALRHELPLRRRMTPFLVGIAGDSGSGKNHTSVSLSHLFGQRATQIVEGDNYHRWQRGDENWSSHTHLMPTANHLSQLLSHTQDLKFNKEISSAHYDHDIGRFTVPQITEPERLMIFQGLHTFYLNEMRKQLDIKIFLNPDENIRLFWKLQRDVNERKATSEKVINTMQKRENDSKKYINPQAQFADWIIESFSKTEYSKEMALEGKAPLLSMRHILNNDDYQLYAIAEILNKHQPDSAKVLDDAQDFTKIAFEIYSAPSKAALEEVLSFLSLPLRQITKTWQPPIWQSGFDGLIQILALILIQNKGFNE